jgi:suppressor of ftsI
MRAPRRALLVGFTLLAAAAAVTSASGVGGDHSANAASPSSNCPKDPPRFIHDSFPQPEFRSSSNGVLSTTLRAALVPTMINGAWYRSSVYEGLYPGPTLVVCPGDTLKLSLRNDLTAADFPGFGMHAGITNLHTHGFFVSPNQPQDNVFVEIPPGGRYDYRYDIPRDHPPGVLWYHPHFHTQSNPQETGGMEGAIIMRGGLDDNPAYRHIGERVLVITQTELKSGADGAIGTTVQPEPLGPFITSGAQFFVNGQLNPTIPIHPGEIQRWSILNLTANSFVKLQLPGQHFGLLARDGNYVATRQAYDSMLVGPSSRREVLVKGGPEGHVTLISAPFPDSTYPAVALATLHSAGHKVHQPMPPKEVAHRQDLRDLPVQQRHLIVYTQDSNKSEFFINDKMFDPNRIDQTMTLGQVNEWTIQNKTSVWHTFHIHINHFQVIEKDGTPVRQIDQEDNVSVSPHGSIKMLTLPKRYTGKFVFHCHILGHEDNGMMATVRTVKPGSPDSNPSPL